MISFFTLLNTILSLALYFTISSKAFLGFLIVSFLRESLAFPEVFLGLIRRPRRSFLGSIVSFLIVSRTAQG